MHLSWPPLAKVGEGNDPSTSEAISEGCTSSSITDYLEQLDHAITIAELSRLLNIHGLTLYRQVEAGTLPISELAQPCALILAA